MNSCAGMEKMIIIYREKKSGKLSTLSNVSNELRFVQTHFTENIIYISYGSKDEISMCIFSFNNHINTFIRHKVVLKSHVFHFKNSGDST